MEGRNVSSQRHHQWPAVPHGLRGWPGRPPDQISRSELDARIADLRSKFGEIGDSRLTVMAALTIADELNEMRSRIKKLEHELAAAQDAQAAAANRDETVQAAVAAALASAAERIEGVTKNSISALAATASRKGDGALAILALQYAGGAAWFVRSQIPGALSILKGAVPAGLLGSDTWRPPTFVGNPGSNAPTAGAAPHSISHDFVHSRGKTPRQRFGAKR